MPKQVPDKPVYTIIQGRIHAGVGGGTGDIPINENLKKREQEKIGRKWGKLKKFDLFSKVYQKL